MYTSNKICLKNYQFQKEWPSVVYVYIKITCFQISAIKESAEKIKVELKTRAKKYLSTVECYSSSLMRHRDKLEDSWKELNNKFQSLKNCVVINMYKTLVNEIDSRGLVKYESAPSKGSGSTIILTQSPNLQSKL